MNWLFKNTVSQGMKQTNYLGLAVVVGALLVLSGCGGGTTASNNATPAKTASIELTVNFPEAEAGKSIIPSYTDTIGFSYCRMDELEPWCDLFGTAATQVLVTRDNPKKTIAVSPGLYRFGALVSNSTDPADLTSVFDVATTEGEVIEGVNTIRMTFLQGDWTFKTTAGANDPVTLGDGTVFNGFKLRAMVQNLQPAASAFDYQQPVGVSEYQATLNTSAGSLTGAWLAVYSQFHSGTTNTNGLIGMDYNLTKGCSDPYGEGQCTFAAGDWGLFMINAAIDTGDQQYENYGPYALLPDSTLTNGSGTPIDLTGRDSMATDGVTITAQLVDFQFGTSTKSLVLVGAAAAKSGVVAIGSRDKALGAALAAAAGEAGKSVVTTNVGTVVSAWYEPVIASDGSGTNKGTWNFDDYVFNPISGQYELVVDGCLVTGDPSGRNYATCGYLNSVYNPTSGQYEYDMGDYSWGLAPTDPQNLGEYTCTPQTAGDYQPWCFYDQNGDGIVDMGTFQFSHYLKEEETLDKVRFHKVIAKGVALPESELTPPVP